MVVEFEITVDDLSNFKLYHIQHSPSLHRNSLTIKIGFPLLWVLLIFFIGSFVDQRFTVFLFALLIFGVILIVLFPSCFRRSIRKQVVKLYSEGQNKTIICKHRISFTSDAVIDTTDFGESKTRWGAIEKIVSTNEYVFIYVSAIDARIVPRRAFPDESAYREFIEAAKRYHESVVA